MINQAITPAHPHKLLPSHEAGTHYAGSDGAPGT
jgi:hypothetical protein